MPSKTPAAARILAIASGAAVFMIGCASNQTVTLGIPSEVTWSFTGSVEAAHQMRSGTRPFTEAVHGVVEFLPEVIVVSASHGACTVRRSELQVRTGRLHFRCNRMYFALGPTDGEVTVPVQQDSEVRAGCARYSDRTANRTCIEWNYQIRTRMVGASGRVHVSQSNAP
jgi:hypothetical protein